VPELPSFVVPMKATLGELPRGEGWVFEVKWDGMRAIAAVAGERTRLWSARGADVTARFPELASLAEATGGRPALLDGELIALDDTGRPSFAAMQGRMHVARSSEAARRAVVTPVTMIVFDLLHLDGDDLSPRPFTARRALLDDHVAAGPSWQRSPVHDDGAALLEVAEMRRLEGVMAKRLDSSYLPGRRSPGWRKIKVRHHDELVVGGWLDGEGGRRGSIGALLVGYYDDHGLRYAGRVGSGLNDNDLRRYSARFARDAGDTSPFVAGDVPNTDAKAAHWVQPTLVIEVAWAEWTPDGRLRHPSHLGERYDKDPIDVRRPG
jgi:bifunctional non-homologous end joining protein LigD